LGLLCCACAPGWGLQRARPLRLYVFDCGHVRVADLSAFSLTPEDVSNPELFVPCYLIEHPRGRLLWEAGLPAAVADAPDGVPTPDGGRMWLEATLSAQLSLIALGPRDIDYLAFSHVRGEHVGQAGAFAGSTLLIQRAEYEAAFAPEPALPGADRALYAELGASPHILLDGDDDVFGDGDVMILSAPGPGPGHQALFVNLRKTGPVLLAGDLYPFAASRRLRRAPTFDTDRAQTLASMERIEAFARSRKAAIWIEHDPEQAEALRLAPDFYE
jgi:glyoxylase-like metal-dependent hydrolase (beta-lactamase superfamily II)